MSKIKEFFRFLSRAWAAGFRGKVGIVAALFATLVFVRMFFGAVSIQGFVINVWRLNNEQHQLAAEKEKLGVLEHHIKLIQNYSPDYLEELGLRHLNIGDPKARILRI